MKNKFLILFFIFVFTLFIFTPIISNPNIFLNRGNDLSEFFWPIYYFVKQQIIINHRLPFWNNLILSGTPLLPDPQAPIFYLPNLIFLFLPIGTAFVVSSFLHTFFGGVFAYLAAKKGFNFSKGASLLASFLYIASPRLAGYLEAGHFGLICAYMWLPLTVLALVLLAKRPAILSSNLLGVSLAGLFYTHTTTFVIAAFISPLFLFALAKKDKIRPLKFLVLGGIMTFGLTAITLLPQLSWVPQTNRYLLITDKQVYPIWLSKLEFIKAIFFPWISGMSEMRNLETEKWLTLGIFPTILAFIGFVKIKRIYKILLSLLSITVFFISLNNSSPLYSLLLTQSWFVFARVATRIWFIIVLIITFLGAYGFEVINKKSKWLSFLIAFLALAEIVFFSWAKITKPVSKNNNLAPTEVYEFLANDHDRFRVFCTTRCLSQKTAGEFGLELVDGYSTLIQKNYNSQAWQMTGTYWNYYTLSIPPIGSYIARDIHPDAVSLGDYNTKYLISPYPLIDKNFLEVKKVGGYLIYLNKAVKPRSPAPILIYTPNLIRVDTSTYNNPSLFLSEVYSPGWNAYLNGNEPVVVQETPNALRSVDLKPGTSFVDFIYEPDLFKLGALITFIFLVAGFMISLKKGWR